METFSPAIEHGIGHPPAPKSSSKRTRYPDRRSGTADGAGTCTITFPGPPEGYHWLLERAVGDATAGTGTLYVGSVVEDGIRDLIPSAVKFVLTETPPVLVPAGNDMIFVFTGLAAGQHVYVNVQYVIERDV
jgi:hypothetical protein